MTEGHTTNALQPLAFAAVAAHTPPDSQIVLYDECVEPIAYDDPTDLVALSVETYTARRAYAIADRYRQRGIPVVMGGYHPTFLPHEALEHADAVVMGDAEGVWAQLVQDVQDGTLRPLYRSSTHPPASSWRFDRRIFAGKRYAPLLPVQYGRGCRFACDFCSIHAFYGSGLRHRAVRDVVAEIEALDHKTIFLVDDNIFTTVDQAADLFRALAPLHIRWACQVSLDIAHHPTLMDLMARSGCIIAVVGFESLNEHNLRQMNKRSNMQERNYAAAVEQFHSRGIMLYATFVFGYDEDTPDSFDQTLEFALRSRFFVANFNPLTPTPGTPLYERLKAEGRLLYDRWWLHPDFRYGQAMFRPRGMSADDLTEGCFRVRKAFNRYGAIAQRAWNTRANCRSLFHLGMFLAANLVSRREIYRKQGQRLG
jgi:radical SAM superfamily enzyme YgiQ (UPF0313 family)